MTDKTQPDPISYEERERTGRNAGLCIHPEGYEDECPCSTGCGCCKTEPAPQPRVTVYGIDVSEWDRMWGVVSRIEQAVTGWRPEDHSGHGSPCEKRSDGSCAQPSAPTPPQDGPHAPQDGPQRPNAGAETPGDPGGRQTGAEGRETLRERLAAALSTLTVLGGAPPARLVPVIDWGAGKTTRIAAWQPLDALLDALLAVRDREVERLEKLHQAHLRVEQRLAGQSLAAEAAVEQIRLHIAAHRPRLQYADPILLGRLEAVLRQVGELEAAGGGEGA